MYLKKYFLILAKRTTIGVLILPEAFYFSVTFLSDSLSLDKSGIYFCYNKQQFLYRPSRDFGKMDYRANDGISSLRIRGHS